MDENNQTYNGNNGDAGFLWKFESRFERTKQWYIIAATVIVTGTVVSFLVGEYLLGIVLILFCGVYLLYDTNQHPVIQVQVDNQGVALNEMLYSYDRIESFGIVRVENIPMMVRFKLKSRTVGIVDIYLDPSVDLNSLRAYLATYLPEDAPVDMKFLERIMLSLRL